MKIYDSELDIKDLVEDNSTTSVAVLIDNSTANVDNMVKKCAGEACSCDFIKKAIAETNSSDIVPFSSILVTDLWNANDDVFCAEEMLAARHTPIHKPINWMHRGSEDTKNETIGVMVNSRVVHGALSNLKYFTDSDIENFSTADKSNTISGQLHLRQDGVIWSQYFPSYAKKIKDGVESGKLYVSMECFFEDFDYILRDDDDSEEYVVVARNNSTAQFTKSLKSYGGKGTVTYKGRDYRVGRLLKGIVFSGQGIVKEPANIKDGKILSVIINDEKSFAEKAGAQQDQQSNMPTVNPTKTNDPMDPQNQPPPQDPRSLPTTYVDPSEHLYNTSEEATFVAENILGCTGYHVYLENRHSEEPFLFADLIGDPDDIEKQLMRPKFLPCGDHKEFLLLTQREGSPGGDGGGGGLPTGCSPETQVCLTISGNNLLYTSSSNIKSFQIQHTDCITGAGGGDTETNGLVTTVTKNLVSSQSSSDVAYIPAGQGTLLILTGEITRECITNTSFYNQDGDLISSEFSSGATSPTSPENPSTNQMHVTPRLGAEGTIISKQRWLDLMEKLKKKRQEFAYKNQDGYNINENQEGIIMTEPTVDYKEMYEVASNELENLKKVEANKDILELKSQNEALQKDIDDASSAIEVASGAIETIPALQTELNELREFVSQADEVISELETHNSGSQRLSELTELVGDTYSTEDIPTLAKMSDESYSHLYDSMNKVVNKIEEAAMQLEENRSVESEEEFEGNKIMAAIEAVNNHTPSRGGDMLVKAVRKDKMSAARNLISNAFKR